MPATLRLPVQYALWLQPRPWLAIRADPNPSILVGGKRSPLQLILLPAGKKETLDHLTAGLDGELGTLVVRSHLPGDLRRDLEARDIGYLDAQGNLHLVLPAGIIHVEGLAPEKREPAATIGVRGVGVVQELLASEKPVTVSGLAGDLGLSLSLVHSVLQRLEKEGLVRARRAGATRWRDVPDRARLLDWLEGQPAARRREQRLDVAIYARMPAEAWDRLSTGLSKADIGHAYSGAAGAVMHGRGPTSVPLTLVRIDPATTLAEAAEAMGAEPTERGPNVRLITDTGRVATLRAEAIRGHRVAPPVRVYLDALGERRGEDVAHHFREEVLGY